MIIDLSGAQWFKSSRSSGGEACVEVAWLATGQVGVRDSKNPTGPALVFAPTEWDALLAGVMNNEFVRSADQSNRVTSRRGPRFYCARVEAVVCYCWHNLRRHGSRGWGWVVE
ncbi:DUF397 domain-containing protein [Nocardia amamiensis]|uniref:DUF397 domain-containing protein n=1 Tax=Nocardia amamiensis TaxID=404578 RepID=UPI003F54188A